MRTFNYYRHLFLVLVLPILLVSCGGGSGFSEGGPSTEYSIGGNVTGLNGGSLILRNNGIDYLTITSNGTFRFANPVEHNGAYFVEVAEHPVGQICTITNGVGNGVITSVYNIVTTCSAVGIKLGGVVSGLAGGEKVSLQNNGVDQIDISANGVFSFPAPIAYNSSYKVTVLAQPAGQTCTVTNGYGAGVINDISSIKVICSKVTYPVSGTAQGLAPGQQVVLQLNYAESIVLTQNGPFTFATPIAEQSNYVVTIGTQPVGKICTVSNGTGYTVGAPVTDVKVICSQTTIGIDLVLFGLAAGEQVTLLNNGSDAHTLYVDGFYPAQLQVAYGGNYRITIVAQPVGQVCNVTNPQGDAITFKPTEPVAIVCGQTTFKLGGNLKNLAQNSAVTLQNFDVDPQILSKDGQFQFSPIPYGGSYRINIATQPVGQTCSVENGVGTDMRDDVSNVEVTCSSIKLKLGGTLTQLDTSTQQQVTLRNGNETLTLNSNGPFSFSVGIPWQGSYQVTIATQPVGQTCTVDSGSGDKVNQDVSSIAVSCSAISVPIAGVIDGLATGKKLFLLNNGDTQHPLIIGANGKFAFAEPIAYNSAYNITIANQPLGQFCKIKNGTGIAGNTPIDNVSVSCGQPTITSYVFDPNPYSPTILSPVIDDAYGNIIGTMAQGSAYGGVFKIDVAGNKTMLHTFAPVNDGQMPLSGLVSDDVGNMYGTTIVASFANDGTAHGTVFKIDRQGVESVLHVFSRSDAINGYEPATSLLNGHDGYLYGATRFGGAGGLGGVGVIFRINTTGNNFSVLYPFPVDGSSGFTPSSLIQNRAGNLYGVASSGGSYEGGVLFSLSPNLTGTYTFKIIYQFGSNGDGESRPVGPLVQDEAGNFYGTTVAGGKNNAGTVFKITSNGSRIWSYSFGSVSNDGAGPMAGLIWGNDGLLYGTTNQGGAYSKGTIFQITPEGQATVLYSFTGGADGEGPQAALYQAKNGALYGTTPKSVFYIR